MKKSLWMASLLWLAGCGSAETSDSIGTLSEVRSESTVASDDGGTPDAPRTGDPSESSSPSGRVRTRGGGGPIGAGGFYIYNPLSCNVGHNSPTPQPDNPYLCLDAQKWDNDPEAVFHFRVCKVTPSGAFKNAFDWVLTDPLYGALTSHTFTVLAGNSCSEPEKVSLSSLPCNTISLLQVRVTSPSGSDQPGDQYYTGTLQVSRECTL